MQMHFESNYTISVTINLSRVPSEFEEIIQGTLLLTVFSTVTFFKTRRHNKVIDLPFHKLSRRISEEAKMGMQH